MQTDEKNPADKIVGSTELLGEVLATFPLIAPVREVIGENENAVEEKGKPCYTFLFTAPNKDAK